MGTPLFVVVTTLNNAATIEACLASVAWADELVVLDSYSTDATCALARGRRARGGQHEFQEYSQPKQMAIDSASNDRVLLLDADEALSTAAAAQTQASANESQPGSLPHEAA